jgi:hypothetical protein
MGGWIRVLVIAGVVACAIRGCRLYEGNDSQARVSIAITDARPGLPDHVTGCRVTIDEVRVRKGDGDWLRLDMVRSPFTIDLLQVTDGKTADLVAEQPLPAGTYRAVRLSVSRAVLRLEDGGGTHEVDMVIPAENAVTDSPIDLDLAADPEGDLTVDFDLSRSVAAEGSPLDPIFTLRPVLHLVDSDDAVTIQGTIANSLFLGPNVEVTVADRRGRPYTRVQVARDPGSDSTEYVIFWLAPGETYQVLLNTDPQHDAVADASAIVETEPGEVYDVNF